MRNFIVTIDGKQYDVAVEEVTNGATVAPVVTQVKTAAPAAPAASKANVAGGTKVTAPFPGMVKKLSVANGASVKKGDVILVFEAMKMDNDITAPCDGVVNFNCAVGSTQETEAVLAVIA